MNSQTDAKPPLAAPPLFGVAVEFTKDSMKSKIQNAEKKLEAAKKLTSELRKQLAKLTRDASADEERNNLRTAKRKAKFLVGDIITKDNRKVHIYHCCDTSNCVLGIEIVDKYCFDTILKQNGKNFVKIGYHPAIELSTFAHPVILLYPELLDWKKHPHCV